MVRVMRCRAVEEIYAGECPPVMEGRLCFEEEKEMIVSDEMSSRCGGE